MKPWLTLSKTVTFEQRPWITVELREVILPNGRVIPDWVWLDTPDFVIVSAVDTQGKFLIFEQTKYAVDGLSLAPVGGYIQPGEDPLAAAKRELLEETGCTAANWKFLGSFVTDANRGNGRGYFYLAGGADFAQKVDSDDLEEQVLLRMTRQEVVEAVREGRFRVAAWQAGVATALLEQHYASACG